jgi:ATP-dependent exoDNAse (exonuclease V) alpha subunit
VAEALSPGGPLAREKVFGRKEVVVALSPRLFGHDPAILSPLVERVLADPEAIPLLGAKGAREPVYSTAHVLATEEAIASSLAAQLARTDAPAVSAEVVAAALARSEADRGYSLTSSQRAAALAICTSGRGAELVIGVAGSGKTTLLQVVREVFEEAGYQVLGTATSGQAARGLRRAAGIEAARTLASLAWRLDHGQLRLHERTVVVLDEAGMTDDGALVHLVAHVAGSGAKLVVLGDHRQLGPVGPGGALGALVARHPEATHALAENVRQVDAAEREALAALRAGEVQKALTWYDEHDRLRASAERDQTLQAVVGAWANDVAMGKDTAMYAWRRANVAELNRRARQEMGAGGRLSGPELEAPGGRCYRSGDRVVTLAPVNEKDLVTSERGTVVTVDPATASLVVRTDEDRLVVLRGDECSAERLDHGYATTVHRAQGATVDRSHVFADGGGRELGYVALSRAREESHVYVVADDLSQAKDDLRREWRRERRPTWAIDTGLPGSGELTRERVDQLSCDERARVAALYGAAGRAERTALVMALDANPNAEIATVMAAKADLEQTRSDLLGGNGALADTAAGQAARALHHAEREAREARWRTERTEGVFARRRARKEETAAQRRLEQAKDRWQKVGEPTLHRLDQQITQHRTRADELVAERERRAAYQAAHPELARRADQLYRGLRGMDAAVSRQRDDLDGVKRPTLEQVVERTRLQAQLSGGPRLDQGPELRHEMGMGM